MTILQAERENEADYQWLVFNVHSVSDLNLDTPIRRTSSFGEIVVPDSTFQGYVVASYLPWFLNSCLDQSQKILYIFGIFFPYKYFSRIHMQYQIQHVSRHAIFCSQ